MGPPHKAEDDGILGLRKLTRNRFGHQHFKSGAERETVLTIAE